MKKLTDYINGNLIIEANDTMGGQKIKNGDTVVFYSEEGVESEGSTKKVGRLYKGTVKSSDKEAKEYTIETSKANQTWYGLPATIKVGNHLIYKV